MRLFVWTGFNPDYSDGLAFAIAENVEEAKKLVLEEHFNLPVDTWGELQILSVDEKIAFCVSGSG